MIRIRTILLCTLLTSCATNPVTGKKEFAFTPTQPKIEESHYITKLQHIDGGPFTADHLLILYLNSIGTKIAQVSPDPTLPYEFIILNTPAIDVHSFPGGKIALSRGLFVEVRNEAQLAAIIAHEMAHLFQEESSQSGRTQHSLAQELGADQLALTLLQKAGYDPEALIGLQKLFFESTIATDYVTLHPHSKERMELARTKKHLFVQKGFIGEQEYVTATTAVRNATIAYTKYEKARKLLRAGFPQEAESLADETIAMYPQEGLFFFLKAQALIQQSRVQDALTCYTQAIEKNPCYYLYYLERAKTYEQLEQKAEAKKDFAASLSLYNTAEARMRLANLHFQTGEIKKGITEVETVRCDFPDKEKQLEEIVKNASFLSPFLEQIVLQKEVDLGNVLQVTVLNTSESKRGNIIVKVVENGGTESQKVALLEEIPELKPQEQVVLLHPLNTKQKELPEISILNAE